MIPAADETEQATKFWFQIKKIAEYITSTGTYSFKEVADACGIKEHALRQFTARPMDRAKYSLTLHKLYIFIAGSGLDAGVIKDRDIFVMVTDIKRSRAVIEHDSIDIYRRFAEHMDSSFNRINRVCTNFNGTFYLYRYSITHGKNPDGLDCPRIIKSQLSIFEDDSVEKMWRFTHSYKDTMGIERQTTGVVLVTIGTVYCVGKIGRGFGVEVLAFKEPTIANQPVTQALIMTVDSRYQPLTARAVLRFAGEDEDENYGAFNLTDIESEVADFGTLMNNPSDFDRALTLNLI